MNVVPRVTMAKFSGNLNSPMPNALFRLPNSSTCTEK